MRIPGHNELIARAIGGAVSTIVLTAGTGAGGYHAARNAPDSGISRLGIPVTGVAGVVLITTSPRLITNGRAFTQIGIGAGLIGGLIKGTIDR